MGVLEYTYVNVNDEEADGMCTRLKQCSTAHTHARTQCSFSHSLSLYTCTCITVSAFKCVCCVHLCVSLIKCAVFRFADVTRRVGVWTLDGDVQHKDLLKFALNKDSLSRTVVLMLVCWLRVCRDCICVCN